MSKFCGELNIQHTKGKNLMMQVEDDDVEEDKVLELSDLSSVLIFHIIMFSL